MSYAGLKDKVADTAFSVSDELGLKSYLMRIRKGQRTVWILPQMDEHLRPISTDSQQLEEYLRICDIKALQTLHHTVTVQSEVSTLFVSLIESNIV
jgi:hypothetical protein